MLSSVHLSTVNFLHSESDFVPMNSLLINEIEETRKAKMIAFMMIRTSGLFSSRTQLKMSSNKMSSYLSTDKIKMIILIYF